VEILKESSYLGERGYLIEDEYEGGKAAACSEQRAVTGINIGSRI